MPKYEIKSWNPVLPKGNDHPMPMVYIKPDKDFLKYAKENNYMVVATVEGSGTIYDGKPMGAVIDSTGYFPNFRPNFYNKYGYMSLTMFGHWNGYPLTENLGTVTIRGLKGIDNLVIKPQSFKAPEPVSEMYTDSDSKDPKCSNLTGNQIGWVITGILIMFCVLLYASYRK